MDNTQIQTLDTSFDQLLESGVFGTLPPEEQIELYFKSVGAEEVSAEKLPKKEIVDYNPLSHAEAVDDLMQRISPSLVHGYDLPSLDELDCSKQVCLIDKKVVGVIAHEKHISNRYIVLLAVSKEWEHNGVMREMVEQVAMMGDPLVAMVQDSNRDALSAFNQCGFQTGNCYNGYHEMYK